MFNRIILSGIFLTTFAFAQFNGLKDQRWYTKDQVKKGKVLFLKNCAICHGENAEKTLKWKKTLSDGSYPPPPLNGTAHAWHHPKSQLKRIISSGGKPYDGKMPPFKDILSSSQQDDIIAYFQHFWNDEVYSLWNNQGGLTK